MDGADRISLSGFRLWFVLLCFGIGIQTTSAQTSLDVEPGLKIPDAKTPWAVDVFEGQRELVPIHHSMVSLNKHTGSNVAGSLAGSFFYKPKLTTELDGLNSRNQLHTNKPAIYVLVEVDQDAAGQGKSDEMYDFVIAKAEQTKNNKRVVDRLAYTQLTGHAKRGDNFVETEITRMKDGWFLIQPKAPMPEGEYVLLPVPKMNGTFSTTVWDFGINLKASNAKDAILATK
ncbi:MAG TPA: hypothetical protein VIX90_15985 [Edaphobacter sp.]